MAESLELTLPFGIHVILRSDLSLFKSFPESRQSDQTGAKKEHGARLGHSGRNDVIAKVRAEPTRSGWPQLVYLIGGWEVRRGGRSGSFNINCP